MMALFNEEYVQKAYGKEMYNEGIIATLSSLVKDGILTVKDASRRAGMTEQEFQKCMAAES